MDDELDDLLEQLCCAGCDDCKALLQAAYFRGRHPVGADPDLIEPVRRAFSD